MHHRMYGKTLYVCFDLTAQPCERCTQKRISKKLVLIELSFQRIKQLEEDPSEHKPKQLKLSDGGTIRNRRYV